MSRVQEYIRRIPRGCANLITKSENIHYISGYTGEGTALIGDGFRYILTDFRYTEQAEQQAREFTIVETTNKIKRNDLLFQLLSGHGVRTLAAETGNLSHDDFIELHKALAHVEIIPAKGEIEAMRIIKSQDEISLIEKAAKITDDAYDFLLSVVKPGMTELNVVALLYKFFLDNGAQGFSFSPIIASGANSSLPHAVAGSKVIQPGDIVTFDIGCKIGGYCSDFTRTIAIESIDPQMERIYNTVLEANLCALKLVKAGVRCTEADAAARDFIASCGYGELFGHGTGHGVGLEIHEAPRLSVLSQEVLAQGMIVTVEPGVYLAGQGGVRIEDLVLVTNDGSRVLSKSSKELVVLSRG